MLYRVFGKVGSGKQSFILEKAQRAVREGRRVFLIVPEQVTAVYEKKVASLCGAASWEWAEVTNFSRLPNVVLRSYGSLAGRAPTDAEKRIVLSSLVRLLKDSLPALDLGEDPDSVSSLLADLEEMRLAGLWTPALKRLENSTFSSPDLGKKISDAAVLAAAFSGAMEKSYSDPSGEGERLAGILADFPFFRDAEVLVDGFWDFTYPQKLILERILSQAKDVFITFTAHKKEPLLFEKSLRAARDLLRMAQKAGVPVRDEELETERSDTPLSHLLTHFCGETRPYPGKPRGIRLIHCRNLAEEASFVANTCLRLTREGASFREIAVLSRDGAGEEILSLTMAEKGVPHFLEEKKDLSRTPLARTVLLACRFALGEGNEEEVRAYLKDGVFPLPDEDRFCLEKYVATWSLSARRMLENKPFSMNPAGYFPLGEEEKAELCQVNRIREEVFAPVRDLSLSLAKGTCADKISAIVSFLARIGTEEVFLRRIGEAKEEEDFEKATILSAWWNTLLEALSALGRALGEEEAEGETFLSLLTLALSTPLPAVLLPGQDRVQIGRVGFARPEGVRYVFVTGLSAGVFPAPEKKGGLFPRKEREELKSLGFSLSGGEDSLSEEYFYFYLAATGGEKGLFLSFRSEGSETENGSLSVIGKRVLTLFPDLEIEEYDSARETPLTQEDAFSRFLLHLGEESREEKALEAYFLSLSEYRERALSRAAGRSFAETRDSLTTEKPYAGRDVNLVYSRLEKYNLCPFSFFARYLLGAKTREKASLGAGVAGSFVHGVLEKVLLSLSLQDKNISSLSDEELQEENRRAVEGFLKEQFGEEVPESTRFLLKRLEESSLLILKHLRKEFSRSAFLPIFFEKSLDDLAGTYKIPLSDGASLCLYGSIDRVDLYRGKNGKDYVRVVDYKTGGHDFSLTDVANGLSLQMLLYLFALWDRGFVWKGENLHPLPAGVIYLNGLGNPLPCDTKEDVESLSQDPYRSLSREGLLVEDAELLSAQDPDGKGEFIPVAWGKDRPTGASSLISLEKLGKLKNKVERDFARVGEKIKAGRIEASPLVAQSGRVDACRYCEYKAICKRKKEDTRPYRTRVAREEIFGEEETP